MKWLIQRKPQFRFPYITDLGRTSDSRLSESLMGVRWNALPPPPRRHYCWPQTRHTSLARAATYRCACGAFSADGRAWIGKNSRRSDRWRRRRRLWRTRLTRRNSMQ